MHLPVELHGQPGRVAALTPLSVDGMVVAASMMQAISARHHGHSYRVEVAITTSGPLSPPGFATDFAELASFGDHLAGAYDHRDLNTVLDAPPTSENLARTLFDWCAAPLRSASRVAAVVLPAPGGPLRVVGMYVPSRDASAG